MLRSPKISVLACALILVLACLAAPASAAAPRTWKQWSEAVQRRYAGFDSLKAAFEQKITHAESGVTEERRGEIFFRKPLLVRWSTLPPAQELLVVTDRAIWQYLPDEDLAYKYPLEAMDDKNAFVRVLFGLSSLADTFEITVQPEEGGLAKLLLDPFEPSMSLLQATMWLEPESAVIRRLLIRDFYGNLNEVSLSDLQFNPSLPAGTFSFTPPPGTEIEDQTALP